MTTTPAARTKTNPEQLRAVVRRLILKADTGGGINETALAEMNNLFPFIDLEKHPARVDGYWLTAHISHLSVYFDKPLKSNPKLNRQIQIHWHYHSHCGTNAELLLNLAPEAGVVSVPIFKSRTINRQSIEAAFD